MDTVQRFKNPLLLNTVSLSVAALTLALASQGSSAYSPDCSITQQEFRSTSTSRIKMPAGNSNNRLQITGSLLRRPLLQTPDYQWIGYELADAEIKLDAQSGPGLVYQVPFAVKLDNAGIPLGFHYAARLKPDDKEKLRAIFEVLFLHPPEAGQDKSDYQITDSDALGRYIARYQVESDDVRSRQRIEYLDAAPDQPASLIKLDEISINGDEFQFTEDDCWHTKVEGRSDIAVSGGDGVMSIRTIQSLRIDRVETPLPSTALLPKLPLDPMKWPMIPLSQIYPQEVRQPLAKAQDFRDLLDSLDGGSYSNKQLQELLLNNDIYLDELAQMIVDKELSDGFVQKLFLAIGKADTANAHRILTDFAVNDAIEPRDRFRSLMALKYAENPLDPSLVETLLAYARNEELGEDSRELAHSSVMVLGIIARNQSDSPFGQQLSMQLSEELVASKTAQQSAALLSAIGNTGNTDLVPKVSDYLGDGNELVRERAALALGQLPSKDALDALRNQLPREASSRNQIQVLESMGKQSLENSDIGLLGNYALPSQPVEVRRAAITALAGQVEAHPEIKTELKKLMSTERDRDTLKVLMQAVY